MTESSCSRRLILNDGYHTDLGPATPEQIEAMERVEARGEYAIAVDPETLEPLWPGDFGYENAITVWVD